MKKILLSTIVLLSFSLSIILFQLSCKKEVTAQTTNSTSTTTITQQNKILFFKDVYGGSASGNAYDSALLWSANYDGSGQQQINVALPTGYVIALDQTVRLSPDGKTIFFDAFSPGINYPTTSTPWSIYSCNIDGSNVKLVVQGTSTNSVETAVAY